jgi:hypothetical protein
MARTQARTRLCFAGKRVLRNKFFTWWESKHRHPGEHRLASGCAVLPLSSGGIGSSQEVSRRCARQVRVVPTLACSGLNFSEVTACRKTGRWRNAKPAQEMGGTIDSSSRYAFVGTRRPGNSVCGRRTAFRTRGIGSAGGAKVGEDV